jgi:hypothetical protein
MIRWIIWFARRLAHELYYIKPADRLPRIPQHLGNEYDPHVIHEVAKAFRDTAIRSPEQLKNLMERYGVTTVDELIAEHYRRQRPRNGPGVRFRRWLLRALGEQEYPVTARSTFERMEREGKLQRKQLVVYTSKYPYRSGGDDAR